MNLKKMALVTVGCALALSLVACGKEEVQEKPEAQPIQMTVSIINDRDVDITGVSIYSDARVDANEQTTNPENAGVSSLLKDGDVLTPGDTVKVTLTVDDPMFNATEDESGATVGEQKFAVDVVDINGNVNTYTGISLSDGATFTISDNGFYNGTPEETTEVAGTETETVEEPTETVEEPTDEDAAEEPVDGDDVAEEPAE